MSGKLWCRIWLLLPALAAAQPAPAPTDALVQKIEALYSKAESLKGRFEIETVNEAIGEREVERGEVFVSRPNRMKWQYTEPAGKVLLLDGKLQWLYLPDEGQAFRGEQNEASSELTLTLLADPGTLEKRFHLLAADAKDAPAGGATAALRLEPRQPQQDFKHIVLGIDAATGKVVSMKVVDSFDNATQIRFSDLELNPRLSGKVFELDLPKNTELLNLQGEPIDD